MSEGPITVAMLCDYPMSERDAAGGSYVFIRDLMEEFRRSDEFKFEIVSVKKGLHKDVTREEDGLTVHFLHSIPGPRLLSYLTVDPGRVVTKVKAIDPDIVHAHNTGPLYGVPAMKLRKKYPTVLRVHGIIAQESKHWSGGAGALKRMFYGRAERKVLKRMRNLLVDTPYVKEYIGGMTRAEIVVDPLGVDKAWFDVRGEERPGRILTVGGVEERKGLIYLLHAAKVLKEGGVDFKIRIAGKVRKEAYNQELKAYIRENDLKKNVKILGFVTDEELEKEYRKASIFTMASLEESQGIVVLEAMATGKPVVVTDIGGMPFMVEEGENGFVVEPRSGEALAEGIVKLLEDDTMRKRFGERSVELARGYDIKNNVKAISALYRKVLAER